MSSIAGGQLSSHSALIYVGLAPFVLCTYAAQRSGPLPILSLPFFSFLFSFSSLFSFRLPGVQSRWGDVMLYSTGRCTAVLRGNHTAVIRTMRVRNSQFVGSLVSKQVRHTPLHLLNGFSPSRKLDRCD
ncbi:hypothetical protein BDV35DRAFT_134773 [Aspergillus flavus]|uniref:Uncharacterized protein n=1 Tax=Aspergillus flavus TaxID=5059 RepID=A0A5N6GIJ3_ASPFL|nr:hypothetical protein BDV35DRAFT_134773 [Aspergillus flavus]